MNQTNDIKGFVRRILPFSSVDGPGNRTAVFLQGCNMNCLYCHNPETIELPKEDQLLDGVVPMRASEVVEEILKVRAFTTGVTFSGGECTTQSEFLLAVIRLLKHMAPTCHVLIDTNGLVPEAVFKELLQVADGFMFDLKSMDEEEHKMLTGRSLALVHANLEVCMAANKLEEIRTVIVPVLLNNYRNVYLAARQLANYDGAVRYKIIKFRNKGVIGILENVPSPSDDQMNDLKRVAQKLGCKQIVII